MEIVIRACAAALAACAVCMLIRRSNPELSLLIGIITCAVILSGAFGYSDGIRELYRTVKDLTGTSGKYIAPVLKCTAIAITTKIGASFCRDASQSAAAASLELAGTVCALACAVPLILNMLTMIGELV